jgi:hypothetical protein
MQRVWTRTEGLRSFLAGAFAAGVAVAQFAIGFLRAAFELAWRWAKRIWDRTEGLRGFLAGAFKVGVDIAKRAIDRFRSAIRIAWDWAKSLWDRTEELRAFLVGAFKAGIDIAKGAIDGVKVAFDGVVVAIQASIEALKSFIEWAKKANPFRKEIGGAVSDIVANADQRAKGGPVKAGRAYLVGEEGPELAWFGRDGHIVPHGKTMELLGARRSSGGSSSVTINHHGQTVTPDTISRGLRMARMR